MRESKSKALLWATIFVAVVGLFCILLVPKSSNSLTANNGHDAGIQQGDKTGSEDAKAFRNVEATADSQVQLVLSGSATPTSDNLNVAIPTQPVQGAEGSNADHDASHASTNELGRVAVEMVWIPPGSFVLGSPADEPGRDHKTEGPQTQVTLTYGFWMGKYEITIGQFAGLVGLERMGNRRILVKGATNEPVNWVSWEDAASFCDLLTQQESAERRLPNGYIYRLPTETEWEYACRAGTTNRFSFGDDPSYEILENFAWYNANSKGKAQQVGILAPNPWGLHDMHGNVCEWCLDFFEIAPGGSVTNLLGSLSDSHHVVKGGAFVSDAHGCRSAWRHYTIPAANVTGFRVALAPPLPLADQKPKQF
jgi:formylglycine-generating enzyme required for sulfatase activity